MHFTMSDAFFGASMSKFRKTVMDKLDAFPC